MDYKDLGKFIRQKRLEMKISLNSFAFANDIDPAILSRVEAKGQSIKVPLLVKIAKGFKQSPSEFLAEFENKK